MSQTQQSKKTYEPLPPGTYRLRMKNYKVEPTKAGNTKIATTFEVMTGEHKNRLVFADYVLTHPNPKAVAVTVDRLSSYLKAIGNKEGFKGDPSILESYLESPFNAEIYIEDDGKGFKPRNKIKKFFAQ